MNKLMNVFTKTLKSRTLILAWGTILASLATMFFGETLVEQNPETVTSLIAVLGTVQLLLRTFTKDSLDDK